MGFFSTRAMQGDKVGLTQDIFEAVDHLGLKAIDDGLCGGIRVGEDNFHAEAVVGLAGHGLGDSAHADQTEGFAGDLGAHHVGGSPAGPFTLADVAVSFHAAACDGQHQ